DRCGGGLSRQDGDVNARVYGAAREERAMNRNNDDPPLGAWYDRNEFAIVIRGVSVRDRAVVTEARRWSTGLRGVAIGEEDMVGIDLSSFVAQSVIVGAHA